MSFSRRIEIPLLMAATIALGVVLPAKSQESPRRRGRSIEFSEPQRDVVKSNAPSTGVNKASLKDLEERLKKPFDLLNPGDNLTGRIVTPPESRPLPSAERARQIKSLLEKRNEWVFLEPEEYFGTETKADDMLDLSDDGLTGDDRRKKTPMERWYYDRLGRERNESLAATNPAAGADSLNPQPLEEGLDKEKELNQARRAKGGILGRNEKDQILKPLAIANPSAFGTLDPEATATRSFADIFGFGGTQPAEMSPEKSRAMEMRMQEFKQLLHTRDLAPVDPLGGGLVDPLSSSPLSAPPATLPPGLDGLHNDNTRSVSKPPSPGPSLQSSLPELPTAAGSLNSPSWEKTIPATEPPRMTLPAPTFNVPQRKF